MGRLAAVMPAAPIQQEEEIYLQNSQQMSEENSIRQAQRGSVSWIPAPVIGAVRMQSGNRPENSTGLHSAFARRSELESIRIHWPVHASLQQNTQAPVL